MRRFIVKAFLFVSPVLAVFGVPLFVLAQSGEVTPVARVIKLQTTSNRVVMFGPGYYDPMQYFKLQSAVARRPDVLVLGTSRTMLFRRHFFKEDVRFFNAGGGVARLKQFRRFLGLIPPGQEPKLVILGLDQNFFNNNWDPHAEWNPAVDDQKDTNYTVVKDASAIVADEWRTVYDDLNVKIFVPPLLERSDIIKIGLNAIYKNRGFVNDGSWYYGSFLKDPASPAVDDYQFKDTLAAVASGSYRYTIGPRGNLFPDVRNELGHLLEACRARNIHVVGFLPPYAPVVYSKMMSMPVEFEFVTRIDENVKPIFDKHGFGYLNATDVGRWGVSDAEFIDGDHGSEHTMVRVFLKLMEVDATLRHYAAAPEFLAAKLAAAPNRFEVFRDYGAR